MVAHGRVELLAHPLSQKYLQMKWNSYGKYFHLANLLFYSVFLLFVTVFTSQLMTNTPVQSSLNNGNVSIYWWWGWLSNHHLGNPSSSWRSTVKPC